MNVIPGSEGRATAADTFRNLYWDTALSWSDPVLAMLRSVVGLDHVVFGTDFPYLRRDLAVNAGQHIATTSELTTDEKAAVLGGTATTVIPRLASLASGKLAASGRPAS
jgi:aminocarboxymuconate-semialdehyde decarboxylase